MKEIDLISRNFWCDLFDMQILNVLWVLSIRWVKYFKADVSKEGIFQQMNGIAFCKESLQKPEQRENGF